MQCQNISACSCSKASSASIIFHTGHLQVPGSDSGSHQSSARTQTSKRKFWTSRCSGTRKRGPSWRSGFWGLVKQLNMCQSKCGQGDKKHFACWFWVGFWASFWNDSCACPCMSLYTYYRNPCGEMPKATQSLYIIQYILYTFTGWSQFCQEYFVSVRRLLEPPKKYTGIYNKGAYIQGSSLSRQTYPKNNQHLQTNNCVNILVVQYSLLDGQKVLIEINKHIVLGNFVMTGVLQQNTSCEYCSYVIYALLLEQYGNCKCNACKDLTKLQ